MNHYLLTLLPPPSSYSAPSLFSILVRTPPPLPPPSCLGTHTHTHTHQGCSSLLEVLQCKSTSQAGKREKPSWNLLTRKMLKKRLPKTDRRLGIGELTTIWSSHLSKYIVYWIFHQEKKLQNFSRPSVLCSSQTAFRKLFCPTCTGNICLCWLHCPWHFRLVSVMIRTSSK